MDEIFRKFIELLNAHKVAYLIIGGYAVNAHGYVRATGDMDILINPNEDNAEKMLDVMLAFGFNVYDFQKEDFLQPDSVVSIGNEPLKIDILCSTPGIDFEVAYARKVILNIEGTPIYFVSLADLIENKKNVGRPKDILDVDNLTKSDQETE